MEISRVGDFSLGWGESLVWDEERQRLYFVDCGAQTLHWLDDGDDELHTLQAPSMPAGIVPTTDGRLIAVLDDGLHLIDPDAGTTTLVSTYPDELGGRCNDACADPAGNLITGKLNLGPDEGSSWWYSSTAGWRLVDDDISNTNGPNVGVIDGITTLIIGDTSKDYFAYDYEPATRNGRGAACVRRHGRNRRFTRRLGARRWRGLWCALFGGRQLARFTNTGLDRTVPVPVENPTDVAFGGADLNRLYVTSIGAPPHASSAGLDGALLVIDGLDARGRLEPRFAPA